MLSPFNPISFLAAWVAGETIAATFELDRRASILCAALFQLLLALAAIYG